VHLLLLVYSAGIVIVFRILVERILNSSLVPFSLDAVERMKRLYTLYANLDEHAIKWVTVCTVALFTCDCGHLQTGSPVTFEPGRTYCVKIL